jgi:antitoxin component YwqK of YwqJK toxin-antitoxin module
VLVDRENLNRIDEYGLKQGTWREYYADGKTKSESYYKNGNLDGQYREFDTNGNISVIIRYNDGLIVEDIDAEDIEIQLENRYDENGNIVFSEHSGIVYLWEYTGILTLKAELQAQ